MQLFPKKQWQRTRDGGMDLWSERRKFDLKGHRPIPPRAFIHEAAYARGPEYAVKLPADAIRVRTLPPVDAEAAYAREHAKARA
jgi:hypothetical protein